MPAKRKPITIHPDDATALKFEELRAYFSAQAGGVPMTNSNLGRLLIEQKHAEVIGNQGERDLIVALAASQAKMQADITELRLQVGQLATAFIAFSQGR